MHHAEEGGRFCNGTGPKGLQCSAATQGQPVAGGALWPRQGRFPSRMGMAEHREPYDARVSRTVLGARGGETPPRDSPSVPEDRGKEALALAGGRPGWGCARHSRPETAGQTGRLYGPGMRWCGLILKGAGSFAQASQMAWKGVRHRSRLRCLAKLSAETKTRMWAFRLSRSG